MVFTEDEDLKSQTNYSHLNPGVMCFLPRLVIIHIKTIQKKHGNLDWFNFLFWPTQCLGNVFLGTDKDTDTDKDNMKERKN